MIFYDIPSYGMSRNIFITDVDHPIRFKIKKIHSCMDKNVLVCIVCGSLQHKYITIYRYHTVASAKKSFF